MRGIIKKRMTFKKKFYKFLYNIFTSNKNRMLNEC